MSSQSPSGKTSPSKKIRTPVKLVDSPKAAEVQVQPEQENEIDADVFELKQLKQMNVSLANSAQQSQRDNALQKLHTLLAEHKIWFYKDQQQANDIKNIRRLWEGLFFMIWHSDKPLYQKQCCDKIAAIMSHLSQDKHKQEWFQEFLYIFNLHWNKVDNFRIDKYLMFIRLMFSQLLTFVKVSEYNKDVVSWYQETISNVIAGCQKQGEAAQGIALQICDVFVQEMNNVDKDATLEHLASILHPFLRGLSQLQNSELRERIVERVFNPILENNQTQKEPESDEEEQMKKKERHHRLVDGGKMPPKTEKEINEMLNTKYVFSGFNILIYAQNYIIKMASDTEIENESGRDVLYKLYDYALQLEPKPDRPELTWGQLQLVNKARSFVTMKMRKRQNHRVQKKLVKQQTKGMIKLKKLMQDQLQAAMQEQEKGQDNVEENKDGEIEEKDEQEWRDIKEFNKLGGKRVRKELPTSTGGEDEMLEINAVIPKKKKKKVKQAKKEAEPEIAEDGANKRVRFDFSQNKVIEFFKHGKVAQRVLEI